MNIKRHSVINFSSLILIAIFHLITSVIIAKTLGPQGKGIYFLVFMIATTSFSFVNSSIPVAAVYYIGTKRYNLQDIIVNYIILAFCLGLIGIGLIFALFKFVAAYFLKDVNVLYLKVALLFIPLNLLCVSFSWIFMGLDDIPKYNLINIVRASLATVFIAIACLFSREILWYIIANLLAIGGACLFALTLLSRYIKKRFHLNFRLMKDVLIYGWKGHFGEALFNIINRLDSYLIMFFYGATFLGFYSVSLITENLWYIPMSVGAALFPKISSSLLKNKDNQTAAITRHAVFLTCFAAFIFLIFSRPFVKILYGESFLPAVVPLCILLPGVASLSISKTLKAYLSGIGKPQIATYSSMVTILVCIFLNFALIPRMGIKGAALATTCSYLVYASIILVAFLKLSGNRLTDTILIKKQDLLIYSDFILNIYRRLRRTRIS